MIPRSRKFLPCCLLALWASALPAQSWFETLTAIGELRDAGDIAAAIERGTELVELASSEFGEASERFAQSQMILAEMQMANADYGGAESSLLSAIQVYDGLDGPISPTLIEPYSALGDAYLAEGQHELALGAYFQARSISRRSYGLYNPGQIEVVNKMADTAVASGDPDTAFELQQERVDIALISFGENSREFFDEIYDLSGWLSEHGYHSEAGQSYTAASTVLQFGLQGEPREVVDTLRLAASNLRVSAPKLGYPSQLMSALQVARSMRDRNPLLEAEILRDIGDWYVGSGSSGSYAEMEEAYFQAWNILGRIENGDELRQQWFSETVPVYLAPFRARELSFSDTALRGYVDLVFTVDAKGTADRIEVITGEPEGLLDSDAKQRIDNSRFRPGVENGRVVEARRVIRLEFGYDASYVED